MEKNTLLSSSVKGILIFTFILLTGILLIFIGNPNKKAIAPTPAPLQQINKVEISADRKTIINAESGEVIFRIDDSKKYLKDSGYFYDPNTFQDTNAKYEGDCFLDAALSNKKDRIVFSTGCLPGDLPQAWIGIIELYYHFNENNNPNTILKFLAAGSGRNFAWTVDGKNISYEAVLGLSGKTETRVINLETAEIIKNASDKNESSGWKLYSDKANSYEFQYPENLDIVNGDIRISVAAEDTTYKTLPEKCPTRTFEGFSDELDGKKTTIGNIQYCEYATGEGVGDTLIEYSIYTAVKNNSLYVISSSTAISNCENFCKTDDPVKCKKDPVIVSCTAENNVQLDLAKKIISTFKFTN